ncbi:MAG: serine/threonine-protein phosphatase, partial [Magnetospirillum sp.]|nr:serine/threonine-protein phosphatase [Magnetospirillum sp.]
GNEVVCIIRDGEDPVPVGIGGQDAPEQATPPLAGAIPDEMHIARRMQSELLPPVAELEWIQHSYGLKITSFFETSSVLGGDLWGLDPMDDHRFSLWLADFSGHGVTAALNTFRLHTLLEHISTGRDRPAAFLAEVNQRLAGLLPLGQYATMLYGVVDVRAGLFTYAAAAAPRPIVAIPGQPVAVGDGSGLPLGVTRKATYVERSLALPPGSALFMASDALTETPAEDGSKLGSAGAVDLVQRVVDARGGDVDTDAILAPFLATVKRPLRDDLTAVCCLRPALG